MTIAKNRVNTREKVYKSLYEVKNVYQPNKKNDFFENEDRDCNKDNLVKVLNQTIQKTDDK